MTLMARTAPREAVRLDDRDIMANVACDACGARPRSGHTLSRRHPTTRPDPETPRLEIVLCDECSELAPASVSALVQLRRAWYVTAWKSGLRPSD